MGREKISILVTDDEVEIRKLICDYLRGLNKYKIISASNGYEALDILKKEAVDIIISDINMPGIKGFDLLNKVKQKYPLIKRIIITGYNIEDYLDLALRYDISNIFVKTVPFNFKELSMTIEMVCREDIFGLKHYFENGYECEVFKIYSSMDLDKKAETIAHFIDHKSELHRLELVIVELLTNAIFYGVRNEMPDQKEDWDHNFTLSEDFAVIVTVAKDPEKYGISICDSGGRLKKKDVLFWLNRQIKRNQNGLPLGLFDTHGRGLFIARKYIDRMIINIDHTHMTEIILLNYYKNTYKGFKPLYINEV